MPQVWSWVVEELVVYTVCDECKPKPYRAITALGLELGGWELRVSNVVPGWEIGLKGLDSGCTKKLKVKEHRPSRQTQYVPGPSTAHGARKTKNPQSSMFTREWVCKYLTSHPSSQLGCSSWLDARHALLSEMTTRRRYGTSAMWLTLPEVTTCKRTLPS